MMFTFHLVPRLLLATVISFSALTHAKAIAQADLGREENTPSSQRLIQNDWSFWPSDQERAPRRTSSGSTRNESCSTDGLVSLTPHEQIGLTGQARPEILFYLPEFAPRQAFFEIQSGTDFLHAASIRLPEARGIVSLALPKTIPDLAAGQQYQWAMVFVCHEGTISQENIGPNSLFRSGWIETQVTLDETPPQVTPSLEQAARYREDGVWYDMIAMLAQLQIGNPNNDDIHQAWRNVLERQQLEGIADAPLIDAPLIR